MVGVFASCVCVVVTSNMNVSDDRCVCIMCVGAGVADNCRSCLRVCE